MIIECGATLQANSTSWNYLDSHIGYSYGKKYEANIDCIWVIRASHKKRIVIKFETFRLESEPCQFDYVAVHDGDDMDATLITKQCGGALRRKTLYSSTDAMVIRFKTDRSIEKHGFRMIFKEIETVNIVPTEKTTVAPIYDRRRDYFVFNIEDD